MDRQDDHREGQVIDITTRQPIQIGLFDQDELHNKPPRVEADEEPAPPEFDGDAPMLRIVHPALDFADGRLIMGVPGKGVPGDGPQVNWIVTSKREFFPVERAAMHNMNLHPKVCCGTLFLTPRFSGAAVKAFKDGEREGDLLRTFLLVKDLLRVTIDVADDKSYSFLTAWIIGTHMFPMFSAYPYIHVHGRMGSGKTTALEVMSKVCFNGRLIASATPAAQYGLINASRSTLLIDETENLGRAVFNETRTIYLHGYARGGSVIRARNSKQNGPTVEYDVYGPRAFASQRGFEGTLASRTVKVLMTRTRRLRPRLDEGHVQSIRDECFLAAMTAAPIVHEAYETIENPEGVLPIYARDYELFQPSLAIGMATEDPGIVEELTEFASAAYRRQQAEFYESSPEHAFLDFLLRLVQKDDEYPGDVMLNGFIDFVAAHDVELPFKWTPRRQGHMLIHLGLVDSADKRRARRNTTRTYFLRKKVLEEVAENYDLLPR